MSSSPARRVFSPRHALAAVLALITLVGFAVVSRADAAPKTTVKTAASSALITISPRNQSQTSGSPHTYNIALSCAGVGGSSCGPRIKISIPLDTSIVPPMTDSRWKYAATSGTNGLITSGPTVVGNDLVVELNDNLFVAGYSGTIRLTATPPNSVTPNNTVWSLTPTLASDVLSAVTAPRAATSIATAKPQTSVAKATADGGSVYQVNGQVTYFVDAKCSAPTTGNLFVDTASLVDTLPAGMTFISATPPPTTIAGQTLTWNFTSSDPTSMPSGCSAGASGTTRFVVAATAPSTAMGSIKNTATFSGTGPDIGNPSGITSTSSASATIATVTTPPSGAGTGYATISKTALAPLAQSGISSGNQYVGTYPGDWTPVGTSPTFSVGAAAASYQTTVTYGMVNTYESTVYDPLPCLDNPLSSPKVGFQSAAYTAVCAHPAIHTQVISVYAPGFDPSVQGVGQACGAGWRPQAVLTNGTTITLAATSTPAITASTVYFKIPSGKEVAEILLPPSARLMNKTLRLTVFGYADASLATTNGGLNELVNTSTVVPQNSHCPANTCAPRTSQASIFTVPPMPTLGISKSFGSLGSATGGTTPLNLVASVATPTQLVNNVVLTDWLPRQMTWANPVTTANFSVAQGSLAATTVTASIEDLQNYLDSGRELIRITLPANQIVGSGSFLITSPRNLLLVMVPTNPPGIYSNYDQIFLSGLAPQQTRTVCNTPTQTGGMTLSTTTYESADPLDFAGDGNTSESYCQATADLAVQATGAAFSLDKTVQGDLDAAPKGPLGIGEASPVGSGVYNLTWTNVGSDTLNNAVIYDLLPRIGDTGVSEGQSMIARESRFTALFVGLDAASDGVTIEYSQATNPCRNEVFPDVDNPTCVNDWSASAPGDLSTVTALRFAAAGPFAFGAGFQASFSVQVPFGEFNKVAWNSAAANASDLTSPSTEPLPAEPPKVGLRSTNTPVFESTASQESTTAYEPLSDLIAVNGLGTSDAVVSWSLLGPVVPVNDACVGLDWSTAPTAESGTKDITGDGTYTIGPINVLGVGCYTWSYSIVDADYSSNPIEIEAGSSGEVTQVLAHEPLMNTDATSTPVSDTEQLIHDHVSLQNTGINTSPAAPASAQLSWVLYGPVTPINESCDGVDWSTAPQKDAGTLTVTGDGIYNTPDVRLSQFGCYSFSQQLPGESSRHEVFQAAGRAAETVHMAAATPTPPTTTPPTTTPPTTIQPTTTPVTTPTPPDGGGGMAYTGDRVRLLLLGALLLMLVGAGLLLARRRTQA